MFIHIFNYRLKCLLRDKQMIFWTLIFPMILATFFNLAFSKIMEDEKFNPINLAVVNNTFYNDNLDFKQILHDVSNGEDKIFNLNETSSENANQLLTDSKVDAIIVLNPEVHLIVNDTGLNETIAKIFMEEYKQTSNAAENILTMDPRSSKKIVDSISNRIAYTKQVSLTHAEPNIILNYFYSLIAMACLYGSFWGSKEIIDIQADLSSRAARVNMAPVHKLKAFLFSLSSALLILYAELLVLLGYLYFVFKIDFGDKLGYVLMTTFIGSVVGLTFGAFISTIVKKGENIKMGILIGITMLGSFLSGMMFDQMKYIVAQNAPVLSYLNPVNLLTDAFYCLYYYDTMERYWLNMGILGIFIILFSFSTYLILRRQKYASL